MSELSHPLLSEKKQKTLWEAVENMVATIHNHMNQKERYKLDREIEPEHALEDFWKLKALAGRNLDQEAGGSQKSQTITAQSTAHVEIEYEWISVCDEQGRELDHACYLLLPGDKGACYGPRTPRSGQTDDRGMSRSHMKKIRQSAADVALMNSIFDTLPSRHITTEFIQEAVQHAGSHQMGNASSDGLSGYQFVLERMLDRSMMQYQEVCNVLLLISWSGLMEAMRLRGMSQDELLDYCIEVKIDEAFRSELAMYVVDNENENSGYLHEQLFQAQEEMLRHRLAGKDLRFAYEKRVVCLMALDQLQYGGSEELCHYEHNEFNSHLEIDNKLI